MKIIHLKNSDRKHAKQTLAVNCGAVSRRNHRQRTLRARKRCFAGATSLGEAASFEVADGWALIFLDEVGELPLSTQRVCSGCLKRGNSLIVGFVQSTNHQCAHCGRYQRKHARAPSKKINSVKIYITVYVTGRYSPVSCPAEPKIEDTSPLLFRNEGVDFAQKYRMPTLRLDEEAIGRLCMADHNWNGNIRQSTAMQPSNAMVLRAGDKDFERRRFGLYLPNMGAQLPAVVK